MLTVIQDEIISDFFTAIKGFRYKVFFDFNKNYIKDGYAVIDYEINTTDKLLKKYGRVFIGKRGAIYIPRVGRRFHKGKRVYVKTRVHIDKINTKSLDSLFRVRR